MDLFLPEYCVRHSNWLRWRWRCHRSPDPCLSFWSLCRGRHTCCCGGREGHGANLEIHGDREKVQRFFYFDLDKSFFTHPVQICFYYTTTACLAHSFIEVLINALMYIYILAWSEPWMTTKDGLHWSLRIRLLRIHAILQFRFNSFIIFALAQL